MNDGWDCYRIRSFLNMKQSGNEVLQKRVKFLAINLFPDKQKNKISSDLTNFKMSSRKKKLARHS